MSPRSSPARRSPTGSRRCSVAEPDGHQAGRGFLREAVPSHRDEFVSPLRASRSFHRPWATAPTDDDRFAAYLADSHRPDFEAMLVCRVADGAILGFFNLSQIVRRALQSAYLG